MRPLLVFVPTIDNIATGRFPLSHFCPILQAGKEICPYRLARLDLYRHQQVTPLEHTIDLAQQRSKALSGMLEAMNGLPQLFSLGLILNAPNAYITGGCLDPTKEYA